jgi:hypothetical protein
MHALQDLKKFPSKEEMRQSYVDFLTKREWPLELQWDGQKHVSCPSKGQGYWRLQSFGFYQGSDWQHRWYVSHRCSKCGTMVQHSQIANDDGSPASTLRRDVYVP